MHPILLFPIVALKVKSEAVLSMTMMLSKKYQFSKTEFNRQIVELKFPIQDFNSKSDNLNLLHRRLDVTVNILVGR